MTSVLRVHHFSSHHVGLSFKLKIISRGSTQWHHYLAIKTAYQSTHKKYSSDMEETIKKIFKSRIFLKIYQGKLSLPFSPKGTPSQIELSTLNFMSQSHASTEISFRTFILLMTSSLCHNLKKSLHLQVQLNRLHRLAFLSLDE